MPHLILFLPLASSEFIGGRGDDELMAELILAHKMRLLEEAVASILDCSQHALLLSTKTAFFSFSSFLLFRLLFSSLAASLN